MKNRWAPLVVVLLLAVAFFGWFHYWSPWKPVPTDGNRNGEGESSVIAVKDFDDFQAKLADRVREKFGVDPGSVVVAPAAYDLGWLLDSLQAYPADRTDCVPTPTPAAIPAPHLFPSYQLASNTAATITLGSDALQQLTSASLDLSHQANLVYSIDEVQVVLMDLKTVDQIQGSGACGQYVSQHPRSRLIRGLVLGKISFKFSTDNPVSAQAKLPKLGGVSATGDPDKSTVTVTDDQPSQILEMVSILDSAPVAASSTQTPAADAAPAMPPHRMMHARKAELPQPQGESVPAPVPTAPVPAGTPHIYLQQDVADAAGAGATVAAKLQLAWPDARVEAKVERVPTTRMPSTPQVRFFNAGDQALANICRDRLKAATGIDARVVRIGLAAPVGQLEVWLQKAANTP